MQHKQKLGVGYGKVFSYSRVTGEGEDNQEIFGFKL
jgi:hypothetical protein